MEANPGFTQVIESEEKQLTFHGHNAEQHLLTRQVTFDSTAVDAGNTPTTTLRAGLLAGIKTSDGNAYAYDPDGTDGTQNPVGVLFLHLNMLSLVTGAVEDKQGVLIIIRGNFKESELINLDERAKSVLVANGCVFDAVPSELAPASYTSKEAVSGDLTVTASDNGRLFVISGAIVAVNFTLPTIAHGLKFQFFNTDDENMVITGSSNIIGLHNDAASTITFSTASAKIGALVEVEAIYHGAALKWIVRNFCNNTVVYA